MIRLRFFWVALVVLLGVSCAVLPSKPLSPEARLVGLRMEQLGLLEQRAILILELTNPNQFKLPVKGLDYEVLLNGHAFAVGEMPDPVTLPADGVAEVELSVVSDLLGLLGIFGQSLQNGASTIEYSISGKAKVMGAGLSLPFSRSGYLPMAGFTD